jgi:hypothetical protein
MSAFDVAKKYLDRTETAETAAVDKPDLTEGPITAVEICSTLLDAHIWLAFDRSFNPNDGQAVFYADEVEFLRTKTPEQLKRMHENKVKLGPGYKVTK